MSPTPSTSWPTTSGAPPLWATQRDESRPTDGAQVAVIAQALGTPLLPWQQYVAEVANERRPDGSYEYQVVVVSVPRQTGKTTLLRAVGVHRALVRRRDVFYTAQTGKDARARWMDLIKLLRVNAALKDRIRIALRGGSEHVEFPGGHVFQAFAPTPESLHGYTPPLVMLDEAFAHNAATGELLMGAIGPAQFTIVDKQIWIVSTAGTAESTFLHDWIERGMQGTERVACFVWAAAEDTNPYTPEGVESFHPAIGFQLNGKTLTAQDVLSEVDKNSRAEYERAFANRRTLTTSHLIPADAWRALADGYTPPPASSTDLVLTYDVALDRAAAAITATWIHDGHVHGRIVQAGPGVAWLADAVADLADQWRPAAVAAVDNGPVLEVTAQLLERGHDIEQVREREYATACGAFLSRIDEATVHHDGDTILERSVTGLVTRAAVSDGVAFSRRHSVGDSSPAIALAVGAWIVDRGDTHARPVFRFAS